MIGAGEDFTLDIDNDFNDLDKEIEEDLMIAEAEESIKILGKVLPSIFNEEFAVLIRRSIKNRSKNMQDKPVIDL